jgi:hypothetical protein
MPDDASISTAKTICAIVKPLELFRVAGASRAVALEEKIAPKGRLHGGSRALYK